MLIRARAVYPVTSAPLDDGAVWIEGGRIRGVGHASDLRPPNGIPVVDLGDSIVLPGLINAHCHLDYTGFARQIPPPSSFTSWLQQLIALKAAWSYTDFAESWIAGMRQLAQSGVTTVGDIEAVPELLPDVLPACPIRVVSFREIITVRNRMPASECVAQAEADLTGLPLDFHRVGLSPHAPYTTSAEVVRLCAARARERGWIWTMHVGESREEQDFFQRRAGPLYDWIGHQRGGDDVGRSSPMQWLLETGCVMPGLLIAHANLVSSTEARELGRLGAQVVHCPRSHDFFQHPPFPYALLRSAGVNVALGTDSLASVLAARGVTPRLDMFAEMRAFSCSHPGVPAEQVVKMVTRSAAAALGLDGETGAIMPGLSADIAVIPWSGPTTEASDAIVAHVGPVSASMVRGRWILPPASGKHDP